MAYAFLNADFETMHVYISANRNKCEPTRCLSCVIVGYDSFVCVILIRMITFIIEEEN